MICFYNNSTPSLQVIAEISLTGGVVTAFKSVFSPQLHIEIQGIITLKSNSDNKAVYAGCGGWSVFTIYL